MKPGSKTLVDIIFLERFSFRLLIVLLSVLSTVFGLALPYYQKHFSESLSMPFLLTCIALSFGYMAFNQLTLFIGQHEAVISQKKLAKSIYSQYLTLKPLTLHNRSVGEVVSLYTTDVPSLTVWLEQSLPYGLTTLFPLIFTPIFLSYFYDLPPYFCFGLVGVLVFMNGLMAYRQSLFFFKFKKLAADRMGLVNEWIQNIRGLKILNWIEGFENKIIKKRKEETSNRIAMVTNGQVMNSISSSITFWLNLAILAFFIWAHDKTLSKSDLIALLWVTTVFLSRPLRQLPWFFTFVFDAWTSFRRLGDFLNLKNQPAIIISTTPENSNSILEVKNLSLVVHGRTILNRISIKIKPGELIALIGPVGSGKSLLMKSLIAETPFTADIFYKEASSYVPQDHFVMSASLRDNMNFDYQSSTENDAVIMDHLAKAQFSFELDRVQDGLETTIGERGVNLSGGQKQRVSLARQLMHPEKILLFDDPLSAVDISTEKKLVDEFVKLKNENHAVLLTTQRFTVLPSCDRILFINHGEIVFDGPSETFLKDSRFESFVTGLI
ncbi:MAG: ABC transporter ATP-binding protein [Bdellovibrio sp.]|nr:ABC transporter ATP-binding protein [Bdellovibrio sp.]